MHLHRVKRRARENQEAGGPSATRRKKKLEEEEEEEATCSFFFRTGESKFEDSVQSKQVASASTNSWTLRNPTYAVQIDCSQYHPYSLVLQVQLPLPMSHVEQQMSGPTVKTSKHCTHLPSVGKKKDRREGGRGEIWMERTGLG